MIWITTLDDLPAHYGTPAVAATVKVADHLTLPASPGSTAPALPATASSRAL